MGCRISLRNALSFMHRIEIFRFPRPDDFQDVPDKSIFTEVMEMATGIVKWYNPAKGFGFISPDQGGGDVFVHASALERANMGPLSEGQALSYELERDQRSGKTSAGQLQAV